MILIRKTVLAMMAFSLALVIEGHTAQSVEFTWRLDLFTVETRPESPYVAEFAQRVFEKSNERLKIDVFYGGALGIKQAEHLRALKTGTVEMVTLYAGYYGRDAPDLAVSLVQGVLLTPQEIVYINPTLLEIYGEAFADWDAVLIGSINPPATEISVFCKDPVNTLEGLKDHKLRVWSKDQVDTFAKLGIPAQIVPQSDLYVALQTGVLDCGLYTLRVAHTISLQEVTDYYVHLHTASALPFVLAVSRRHWEKLPKDIQDVVLEAGEWVSEAGLFNAHYFV